MSIDAQIGSRLAEERKRLGLSQQRIADAVEVRREMWAKYEAGAEPGAAVLGGAAAAGVDVQYVLTGVRADPRVVELFRSAADATRRSAVTDEERRELWRALVAGAVTHASDQQVSTDEQRLLALYRLADAGLRKAVVGALAAGEMPQAAKVAPTVMRHGNATITIHPGAEVGGVVHGDQVVRGGQTFSVGGGAPAKRVRKPRIDR